MNARYGTVFGGTASVHPFFLSAKKFLFHWTDECAPVQKLPKGDWLDEVKLDGYRAAFKDGKECKAGFTQSKGLQLSSVARMLSSYCQLNEFSLDAEIAALDEKGRSSLQLLQVYKSSEQCVPLVYYVFDLFFSEGKDLRKEPLSARRKLLAGILKKAPPNIRVSEGLKGSKEDLLRVVRLALLWALESAPRARSLLLGCAFLSLGAAFSFIGAHNAFLTV
jgi:ATP dependent DNA ligase-like protein